MIHFSFQFNQIRKFDPHGAFDSTGYESGKASGGFKSMAPSIQDPSLMLQNSFEKSSFEPAAAQFNQQFINRGFDQSAAASTFSKMNNFGPNVPFGHQSFNANSGRSSRNTKTNAYAFSGIDKNKSVIGGEIGGKSTGTGKTGMNQTLPQPNRKVKPALNTDPFKEKMAQDRAALVELTKQFGTSTISDEPSGINDNQMNNHIQNQNQSQTPNGEINGPTMEKSPHAQKHTNPEPVPSGKDFDFAILLFFTGFTASFKEMSFHFILK